MIGWGLVAVIVLLLVVLYRLGTILEHVQIIRAQTRPYRTGVRDDEETR